MIARLPFSVEKTWGTRGILKVRLLVNGFEYRSSLFPTRSGTHFILVNKKMQKAARIKLGDVASFSVTPDLAPRILKLPEELERALNEDRKVRKWFDRLTYSIRKWLSDIVANAASPATRNKRAERIAEQIMETMEAEEELPPLIRQTLNRHPGAERAWKNMTELQRRYNLLAIFYYQTPQTRLKRIEKVIEQALAGKSRER